MEEVWQMFGFNQGPIGFNFGRDTYTYKKVYYMTMYLLI